ncbi:MAG: polysaccharide biosynthesis tyrosine autokinase [Steroidobacteraceae bacterium]
MIARVQKPQKKLGASTIGAILVELERLSPGVIDVVKRYAAEYQIGLDEAAVRLKLVTQKDIDLALAQQFKYPTLAQGGHEGLSQEVVAAYNPQSEAVEPLRALRSQLTLRWRTLPNRTALAITSPDRGDGRSWLAANLATVFAQAGDRTLLVDTDLRRPCQHKLFNIDNSAGLSALLTGRALGRDVVRRINPELRLYVLPAGMLPPNPQELLLRPAFELVLTRLAEQFDVIILDTPPANESADAQILAARAGAAILVARRNYSKVADLEATMGSFSEIGVTVVGSVINEHHHGVRANA